MADIKEDNNTEEIALSKVRQDIVDDCMIELGYPVVTLFITTEQINKLIDFAVRKCASKACIRFLQTFYSGSGVIDVKDYSMETVSNVYSADTGSSNSDGGCSGCGDSLSGCNICDKLCQYRTYSNGLMNGDWNNQLYDMLAYNSARSELKKLELDDYYLDVQNQKLYLDNYTGFVTVEYTKSNCTVEELQNDSQYKAWVRDYTLALVKITEGRIRSKYKVSSGVFEIESDELISEGNNDKQELEEKLNDDIGYYNIMR